MDTTVPFGRPTDNAILYVLGSDLRPMPPGCPGELYIGGEAVTRGYLNQGGRTAERYLPDPHSFIPGARMYATGDRVRVLHDGNLVFLGRGDGQVKVRGYRVELSDVEAALNAHPAVCGASVAVCAINGASQLVGYVVSDEPDIRADPAAVLRPHLARRLPAYMVPTAYVWLDRLPVTVSGKIDSRALPAPTTGSRGSDRPPTTSLEMVIAEVWRDALGVDHVGLDTNFFDAGGHSLLLTEVCLRIGDRLGRRVSPLAVFRHPTIAELGEYLSEPAGDLGSAVHELPGEGASRRSRLTMIQRERRDDLHATRSVSSAGESFEH